MQQCQPQDAHSNRSGTRLVQLCLPPGHHSLTFEILFVWLQDRFDSSSSTACPSCGGSGYEACMCTRWSDGDVGCNSCAQTGYTRCKSCGGNGKAVPRVIKIRKDNL
jgi:hypothetical protein